MDTRKTTHSSAQPRETSPALTTASADTPLSPPPVVLPSDLATALRYLEDSELQRLQAAVEVEIARRKRGTSTAARTDERSAPTAARPTRSRIESTEVAELPEGKANLIRASFDAGLKAPTIARTFGVSISLVNRIIRATKK